jgi:hypothetical protein
MFFGFFCGSSAKQEGGGGVVQQAQGLNHLDLVAEKLAGNLNSDVFSVLNPVS